MSFVPSPRLRPGRFSPLRTNAPRLYAFNSSISLEFDHFYSYCYQYHRTAPLRSSGRLNVLPTVPYLSCGRIYCCLCTPLTRSDAVRLPLPQFLRSIRWQSYCYCYLLFLSYRVQVSHVCCSPVRLNVNVKWTYSLSYEYSYSMILWFDSFRFDSGTRFTLSAYHSRVANYDWPIIYNNFEMIYCTGHQVVAPCVLSIILHLTRLKQDN